MFTLKPKQNPIWSRLTDGKNFTTLTNLPPVSEETFDLSKVTIIGNGWGRSSNIYESGDRPASPELARAVHAESAFLKRDCSNYFTIDSDNSLDYNEILNSMDNEKSCSSGGSAKKKSSVSFSNINTILKKNPNITIRTVIEHRLLLLKF